MRVLSDLSNSPRRPSDELNGGLMKVDRGVIGIERRILSALVRSFGIARDAACAPPPFIDRPSSVIKEVV